MSSDFDKKSNIKAAPILFQRMGAAAYIAVQPNSPYGPSYCQYLFFLPDLLILAISLNFDRLASR